MAVRLLWAADRRTIIAGAAFQIAAGAGLAVEFLIANRLLEDLSAADADTGSLPLAIGLLAIAGAILAGLTFAGAAEAGTRRLLGERVVRHVQGLILDTAAAVDVIEFENPAFYDRLQRAQVQGVPTPLLISGALLEGSFAAVASTGIAVALLFINPLLLPFVLIGAIPGWIASARSSEALYSFAYGHTPNDRMRAALAKVVTTRKEVDEARAFRLYPFIRSRWDTLFTERVEEAASVVRAHLVRFGVASAVSAAVTAALFGTLAYFYLRGSLSLAAAATGAFAAQQLGARLLRLATSAAVVYENALYLDDFENFRRLYERSRPADGAGRPGPDGFARMDASGVVFHYPDVERRALDGVSLTLRAGEVIALVGENGSGKTTLAKLLCGLYRPASGMITWDGVDLRELDADAVAACVSVVFQDFVRYPLSLGENVGVGDVGRIDDRIGIEAAMEAAGAAELVSQLPRGLDTMLDRQFKGGVDLSVGQWQRLALARAFFRAAPFIVLDEPTAALDPRMEKALFDSMRTLSGGRTVLLISHRFSTVKSADRIVVLHRGRIIEEGTHDELMKLSGQYAELFTLQASAYLG